MKPVKIGALLLALLLLLNTGALALVKKGAAADDFTVFDLDGKEVKLREKLDGKPIVLNIWASWCPPCVNELPCFEKAAREYGDKVNFMMVNLTDGVYETEPIVRTFLTRNAYTFPAYLDKDGEAASLYVGQYIPMTWFINSDGTVYDCTVGGISEENLLNGIRQILGN